MDIFIVNSVGSCQCVVCQESLMDIIFTVKSVGSYKCVVCQESPTDIHGLISQRLEADGLHIHCRFSWQI